MAHDGWSVSGWAQITGLVGDQQCVSTGPPLKPYIGVFTSCPLPLPPILASPTSQGRYDTSGFLQLLWQHLYWTDTSSLLGTGPGRWWARGRASSSGAQALAFWVEKKRVRKWAEGKQRDKHVSTAWPPTTPHLVSIKIELLTWAKDGEALYSQQKQDRKLTVAQIMNSLSPNSDWNWRNWRKPLDHLGIT